MSLNPSGAGSTSWNFSRPEGDGYSLEIWGTVVSLQEVQAREYNPNSNQPGRPSFWPDGNPKMNIRMGMAMPDGSLKSITFGKAGKQARNGEKPSLHMQLFNLTNSNMLELIGKTLHMWTWPANPTTGEQWQRGNPRLFGVEEVTDVKYELSGPIPPEYLVPELLANDSVHGGQPTAPAPQMMQPTQVPQMQGNFYAAPTAQPMPAPQATPAPQPMVQPAPAMQAPQPVPATQAMPPQQQAPMPQGMDPAVAAAMQAVGAVNVQPVADTTGGVYDDGIPF